MLESKRAPILPPPNQQKKYEVIIDSEQCDGCKICINFCPKDLLKESEATNSRMLHFVEIINFEDCLGCKQCERICPMTSIYINEINLHKGNSNEK